MGLVKNMEQFAFYGLYLKCNIQKSACCFISSCKINLSKLIFDKSSWQIITQDFVDVRLAENKVGCLIKTPALLFLGLISDNGHFDTL